MSGYACAAKRPLLELIEMLEAFVARDADQPLRGITVSIVEAGFERVLAASGDDPRISSLIGSGAHAPALGAMRCSDALTMVMHLYAAVGDAAAA